MLQTINNKIRRSFSGSAERYDLFSGLHREIADKLLAVIVKGPTPAVLLDAGCGTGYLTGRLKDHFPQSMVIGLDFAQGMLEAARPRHKNIEWVLADVNRLPFSDGIFDVVVSNLAYQWAGDLSQALSEARRVLAPQGVLACTLFGYHTCRELFRSLEEAKAGVLKFNRLPDVRQVQEALAASGFERSQVDAEEIKIEFKDMHGLLSWLKSIGANHLPREGYVGPEGMARAASIYREKFSYRQGVGATFEVVRIYAKK